MVDKHQDKKMCGKIKKLNDEYLKEYSLDTVLEHVQRDIDEIDEWITKIDQEFKDMQATIINFQEQTLSQINEIKEYGRQQKELHSNLQKGN